MMLSRLDLDALQATLAGTPLQDWSADLTGQIDAKLAIGHGDLPRWYGAVQALPELNVEQLELLHNFTFDGSCPSAIEKAIARRWSATTRMATSLRGSSP